MKDRVPAWMRLTAFFCVAVLLSAGLVHALIPHDDGDSHTNDRTLIAESLHNAIQHEDKKILVIIAIIFLFALFSVRRSMEGEYALYFSTAPEPFLHTRDSLQEELRRGTAKYRKFG